METEFLGGRQIKWGKKLMGWIIEEKEGPVFCIPKVRSKHYFRIYSGYALNAGLLKHLIDINVNLIRIIESDTKHTLSIRPTLWKHFGTIIQMKGFEEQVVCPEIHFKKTGV